MTEEEYLKQRVEDQIGWYDSKSKSAQSAFKRLRILEIFLAALIPLLAAYSDKCLAIRLGIALIGVIIAFSGGLLSLYQFQERWLEYRTVCESLRHEKWLFLTKAEPYDIEKPFALFVQRVESLISKENSSWAQATRAQSSQVKGSSGGAE